MFCTEFVVRRLRACAHVGEEGEVLEEEGVMAAEYGVREDGVGGLRREVRGGVDVVDRGVRNIKGKGEMRVFSLLKNEFAQASPLPGDVQGVGGKGDKEEGGDCGEGLVGLRKRSKSDAREGDACSGSGWGSSRRLGGGSFGFMFGGENSGSSTYTAAATTSIDGGSWGSSIGRGMRWPSAGGGWWGSRGGGRLASSTASTSDTKILSGGSLSSSIGRLTCWPSIGGAWWGSRGGGSFSLHTSTTTSTSGSSWGSSNGGASWGSSIGGGRWGRVGGRGGERSEEAEEQMLPMRGRILLDWREFVKHTNLGNLPMRDKAFGKELMADATWLQLNDAAQNARFVATRVATDTAATVAGGFGVMVIVVLVNVHALLSLDRFHSEPLVALRSQLLGTYVAAVLLPAGVGMVLPFVIDHRKHVALLQRLLICTRLAYVAVSLGMHRITRADGWTLHFPLAITGVTCFHSGLLFWQNVLTMAVAIVAIFPCILAQNQTAAGLQHVAYHSLFLWMNYSAIYLQAATALSSWLGLQLVERRQVAMQVC